MAVMSSTTLPTSSGADVDAGVEVPWLDDDEMAAWRGYAETVFDLNTALEADLAPHGLTLGDYQVLVYLSEADDRSMRMCDLAAQLQLSPSGLTRRLDGLVKAGLVERRPSEQDRRVMLAVLDDQGLRYLEAVAPTHVRSVRRHVIDRLDRADIAAMARIFGAIRDGLADDRSTAG
jgi:DNA-binding MarR family transcriptional regulator